MKKFIKINEADNVVVALAPLEKDFIIKINDKEVKLLESVEKGHKVALNNMGAGENIIKYGMPIGHTLKAVKAGEWVHVHNVKTNLSDLNKYTYVPKTNEVITKISNRKVNVYKRADGNIGIRNDIWIIPTVGCVNGISEMIKTNFLNEVKPEGIDNITVLNHDYGCSQLGDDHENTRKILQDLTKHPNAGGILIVGLGCEYNQVPDFKETLGEYGADRVKFLVTQESDDEIEDGKNLLKEIYNVVKEDKREEAFISDLKIGLECGGSDGFSGITANPMLGKFSDYLGYYGGTTVLTEVPEMFGAETILMERCEDKEVFQKTVELVNDFKEYFISHNQVIYENPSPGNKNGGISTLEDKSLGCVQKSGNSKVTDVLKYGDIIKKRGLNLLSAPGNDLVATTALEAAGCNMVLFTTGRGTPYGGITPTVKIATNTELAEKKSNWIDFNAGRLLSEDIDVDFLLEEFINYIVRVADGELTGNERNNGRGFAIFKSGVTL